MWTPATRRRHSREHLRYASDVSDEEWALLEPHLPAPCLTGRPRAWPMREIVNAIFYVLPIRLRLAALARQLPAAADGLRLVPAAARRLRSGAAEPPSGHARPRAQRARRQPFGGGARQPKRQDDGGRRAEGLRRRQEDQGQKAPRPRRHRRSSPGAGASPGRHPGPRRRRARAGGLAPRLSLHREGLRRQRLRREAGCRRHRHRRRDRSQEPRPGRPPDQVGFAVQPRRWVVERFFAWIGRNRRLAKDFEATLKSARAFLYAASIMLLTRRLAQSG